MSYYTYDDFGLPTGTSEAQTLNSTEIPYPDNNGYYQFARGDWQLIFGITVEGNLTVDVSTVSDKPAKYEEIISTFELEEYPQLSANSISSLFDEAEEKIRSSTLFTTHPSETLNRSYVVYRRGDEKYLSVGMYWISGDRTFNAKVTEESVSDFYEIFDESAEYIWKELDPTTFEPVALYIDGGNIKLAPTTLEVLQTNNLTNGLDGVPADFAQEMLDMNLPFTDMIWQYGNKPYGEVVAFSV